jgi:hypothetical protein
MRRLIFLAFLLISVLFSAEPKIKYPPLNPVEIPPFEKIVLPNGLSLYLIENDEFPIIEIYTRIVTFNF